MSFSLDMSRAINNIRGHVNETVRGTLFGVSRRVILGTPVADPLLWQKPDPSYIGGTLRGAWNASIGSPDATINNAIDTTGQSTINDMSLVVNRVEIGQTFYLTNPQPYAMPVEYGWSSQAPAGMLRVAVAETQAVLNSL